MTKQMVRYLKLIFGINPKRIVNTIWGLPYYHRSYKQFSQHPDFNPQIPVSTRQYPCLLDRQNSNGQSRGHNFYQDLWVAQQIAKDSPVRLLDIGSRVDGVSFRQADMMGVMPNDMHEITDSLISSNGGCSYGCAIFKLIKR